MFSYLTNISDKKISNKKLSLVISLVIGVLFLASVTFLKLGGVGMEVLYNDLELAERNEITHFLDQWGKVYSVDNGDILVSESELREIRMMLASEGLPSTGSIVGYEIFNKSESLGSSGFTQNVNLIRALEGELGRTVMSFDKIRKARVHLVIPKREVFSQNRQRPTASVVLKIANSMVGLQKKEIEAIAHLVASSVVGLNVGDVTIVTTDGNALRLPGQDSLLSLSMQEYKVDVERSMRDSVEALVEKTLGSGKVRVEVTADVDFDQLTVDSEIYDPDGQVVRSTQTIQDKDSSKEGSEGMNTSVGNNIPNGTQPGREESEAANYNTKDHFDETINYEISRERRKHVKGAGEITKLSLAVLVDGNYTLDEESGNRVYVPLEEDVMQKLKVLIASAVGLQKSRGDTLEVVNMPFYPESEVEVIESWLDNAGLYSLIKLSIISVIILLISLLVFKPLINKLLDLLSPPSVEKDAVGDDKIALEGKGIVGMKDKAHDLSEGKSPLEILNDLVAEKPDTALQMLQSLIGAKPSNK